MTTNIVLKRYAATLTGLMGLDPVLIDRQKVFIREIPLSIKTPVKIGDGLLRFSELSFNDTLQIETDSAYDLTQAFLAVDGNEVEITNISSGSIIVTTESEPITLGAGETGKYRRISGAWIATAATGAGGGISNYLGTKASDWTANPSWELSEEVTDPIDLDGTTKAILASGTSQDVLFYQEVTISEIDTHSLLQLSFKFKDVSNTDFSKLSYSFIDEDNPSVSLRTGTLLEDSEYNSASEVYSLNINVPTTESITYRVMIKTNSSISTEMIMLFSTFFLCQVNRFTAPLTREKAGTYSAWGGVDLPDNEHLYSSGPEVAEVDYPDLFAEIRYRWSAQRQADGWSAPSAGHFYPGPSAGFYFRSALHPLSFTSANIGTSTEAIDLTNVLPASVVDALRDSTPFIFKHLTGTNLNSIPQLNDNDTIYVRGLSSGLAICYPTEADAIADTNKYNFTNAGSGTFQLIQVGGYLDDAFQGHVPDLNITNTGGAASRRVLGEAVVGNTAAPPTDVNSYISGLHSDRVNGDPRISNETRPNTAYITWIVRAVNARSVELMKKETNREDVGEIAYSYKAPDSNGKGAYDSLVFDSSFTHNWSEYPELLKIGASNLAMYITDNGDGTFNMRDLSYDTGRISRSSWTGGLSLPVVHNLGINASELNIKFSVSSADDENHYYETFMDRDDTFSSVQNRGYSIEGSNQNNLRICIGVSGLGVHISAGTIILLTTQSNWFYRVIISRKDAPQDGTYAYLKTRSLTSILLAESLNQPGYNGTTFYPPTLDISTTSKVTSVSKYWSTGSEPKLDGFTWEPTWTGGTGDLAIHHSFSVPSGVTFWHPSSGKTYTPGDGVSLFALCGYGKGGMKLIKDEANNRVIIDTDGIFDEYINSDGIISKYYTDRRYTLFYHDYTFSAYPADITYPRNFRNENIDFNPQIANVTHTIKIYRATGVSWAIKCWAYVYNVVSEAPVHNGKLNLKIEGEWSN